MSETVDTVVSVPDTFPHDWSTPSDYPEIGRQDDEDRWGLRFRWKRKTYTTEAAPRDRVLRVHGWWLERNRSAAVRLECVDRMLIIPVCEIRKMEIVR